MYYYVLRYQELLDALVERVAPKTVFKLQRIIPEKLSSDYYNQVIDRVVYQPFVDSLFRCYPLQLDPQKILTSVKKQKLKMTGIQIPTTIANLQQLRYLCIGTIIEVPKCVTDLENLETLKVWNSPLGSLPRTLGNLTKLRVLELEFCRNLQRLPASVTKLGRLEKLRLNSCDRFKFETRVFLGLSGLKRFDIVGGHFKHWEQAMALSEILRLRGVDVEREFDDGT